MNEILNLLQTPLAGISLWQLLVAFFLIFAGFAAARLSAMVLDRLNARLANHTGFHAVVFAAAGKPAAWAFIVLGIYLAVAGLPLPVHPINLRHFVTSLLQAATIALAAWFAAGLSDGACKLWAEKAAETATAFDDQLVPIVRKSAKVFIVTASVVMIIQSLGYSVSSLVAGLGLSGAALALASKDTIANLFGSIVIFLDRPFVVGDWVEIGAHEGTVEEVGLRVTRLRTFAHSVITIPNAQLTTMTINNWSRMRKRRIKMTLGLTYSTRPEQMVALVEDLREILRNDARICQDYFLVNFVELGASSLDIMVYCFTETTVWGEHLEVRQELLLNFMAAVEKRGLGFAFPTRTLHVADLEKVVPAASEAMMRELPN